MRFILATGMTMRIPEGYVALIVFCAAASFWIGILLAGAFVHSGGFGYGLAIALVPALLLGDYLGDGALFWVSAVLIQVVYCAAIIALIEVGRRRLR